MVAALVITAGADFGHNRGQPRALVTGQLMSESLNADDHYIDGTVIHDEGLSNIHSDYVCMADP